MKKLSVFSVKTLVLYAIFTFIGTGILVIIESYLIQNIAIIQVKNYSSVITTLWSIQATLSTLLIAFLSIFSHRFSEINYGITVKELLMLKKSKYGLNFYEVILFIYILTGLNFVPVLVDCLNTLVAMVLVEILLMLKIIMTSLKLSVDDQYAEIEARNLAVKLRDDAFNQVDRENVPSQEGNRHKLTESEEMLVWLLDKIVAELKDTPKNSTDKLNIKNKSLFFLLKVIQEDKKNLCKDKLLVLFNQLAYDFKYMSAVDIAKEILTIKDVSQTNNVVDTICSLFYANEWSKDSYTHFLKYLKYYIEHHMDDYFYVFLNFLMNLCKNSDTDTLLEFLQILLEREGRIGHKQTAEILHMTAAYLYYLDNESNDTFIKHDFILNIFQADIQVRKKNTCLSQYILDSDNLEGLCLCVEEIEKNNGAFYQKHITYSKGAYFITINKTVEDYCKFMLFYRYKGDKSLIDRFSLQFLMNVRKSTDDNGTMLDVLQSANSKFSDCCNIPLVKKNPMLNNDINALIIIKLIDEAEYIRSHPDEYLKKIKELQNNIVDTSQNSCFFTKDIVGETDKLIIPEFFDYSDFSGKTHLLNHHEILLEEMKLSLYNYNTKYMNVLNAEVEWFENLDCLEEIVSFLYKEKSSLNFNSCYYRTVSDLSVWQSKSDKLQEAINELDNNIIQSKERLNVFCGDVIYANEEIFKPRLTLEKNFMKISCFLSKSEVDSYIKLHHYNDGQYFITLPYNSQTKISCSYQQCYDYVCQTKLKISFEYSISVATEKFGACVTFGK